MFFVIVLYYNILSSTTLVGEWFLYGRGTCKFTKFFTFEKFEVG